MNKLTTFIAFFTALISAKLTLLLTKRLGLFSTPSEPFNGVSVSLRNSTVNTNIITATREFQNTSKIDQKLVIFI